MRLLLLSLASSAALAAPAAALTPAVPDCWGEALAGPEAGLGSYDVTRHGNGMILYERHPAGSTVRFQVVVEHCPSRQRVESEILIADPDNAEAWNPGYEMADLVRGAMEADQTYTLDDLAAMVRATGAHSQVTRVSYSSCGCRLVGGQ